MPVQRKNRKWQKQWYGRVKMPDGKTKEKRFPTKTEAITWEVLVKERLKTSRQETDTISLLGLAESYLDHVQARGLSKQSYDDKARTFARLFEDIDPTTLVANVDFPRISKHYNRIAREISGITANRTADHLHTAYEYGVRYLGLPRPNPWGLERGDRYKVEHKPRYVPPEEDFWKLFEVADRQEQCILQFAFDSLARKNEILSLQPADVDLNATQRQPFGKVRLWTNKRAGGREYDWVAIDMQSTADALREQLRKTAFQEYVFVWPQEKKRRTWIDDMMPTLCEKAEVKPFGLHGIRHLGACLLDDDGVPLVQIQSRLRHKSATTTAKYLHDLRGVRPPERKTAKVVPLKQLAPGAANTEGEK